MIASNSSLKLGQQIAGVAEAQAGRELEDFTGLPQKGQNSKAVISIAVIALQSKFLDYNSLKEYRFPFLLIRPA